MTEFADTVPNLAKLAQKALRGNCRWWKIGIYKDIYTLRCEIICASNRNIDLAFTIGFNARSIPNEVTSKNESLIKMEIPMTRKSEDIIRIAMITHI